MLEAVLAGLFGLLIGSFLNVCIFRWPKDLSVVRPRSFCPACERPIAWFDNIPVFSYLALRGKCRHCQEPIPLRYPIVEILTAALFFSFVMVLGPTPVAFKFCLLAALLLGMIFADLEERILPDEFTWGGVVAGLLLSWFIAVNDSTAHFVLSVAGYRWGEPPLSLAESVLGAFVPSFFLWLTGAIFEKVRHKPGLGFGDVKMVAAIGAFLGIRETLLTLVLGSLLGSVTGVAYILIAKKDSSTYELPFGSFLGAAAIAVSLIGQRVIAWYGKLF